MIKFLATRHFAFVLLMAAVFYFIIATILESLWGTEFTSLLFYKSPALLLMGLLAYISIAATVLIYFRRGWGFCLIHLGLLLILAGAYVTYYAGLEGQMVLNPSRSNNTVVLSQKQLTLTVANGDQQQFALPETVFPQRLNLQFHGLDLVYYLPFAVDGVTWERADQAVVSLLMRLRRGDEVVQDFILSSDAQWDYTIGPLRILLLREELERCLQDPERFCFDNITGTCANNCMKTAELETTLLILGNKVMIFDGKIFKALTFQNQRVSLPWMELNLELIKRIDGRSPIVQPVDAFPAPLRSTGAALQIVDENKRVWWAREGEIVSLAKRYTGTIEKRVFMLPFALKLINFEVKQEQNIPADYISQLEIDGHNFNLAMNRPLTYGGFKFYQSSYQQTDGQDYVSIVSVNYDPGRWIKYLGSFLLLVGLVWHYWKKAQQR